MATGSPASPLSLMELCLARNAELLLSACRATERECGDFSQPACVSRTEELQSHLLARCGNVTNDVCAKAHELLRDLSDARILFALESHRYVRSFAFRNELSYGALCVDTAFWESQLGRLTNVTVLDIWGLCCTDAILSAICDNCRLLEEFRFESPSNPRHRRREKLPSGGVERLLELERLRFVEEAHDFRGLADAFLGRFFRRLLPRLENFSHPNVRAFVLDNLAGAESLALTRLTLHDASPENVTAMLRLCPRLSRLRLAAPYGGMFDDLADARPDIRDLRLDRCSGDYVPGLCHFLLVRGDSLTSLTLTTDAVFSVNEVALIGECCPRLRHLAMEVEVARTDNPYTGRTVRPDRPIFGCLDSLSLDGSFESNVDPRIFDLLLEHDSGVGSLTLSEIWIVMLERSWAAAPPGRVVFPNLVRLSVLLRCWTPLRVQTTCPMMQLLCSGCPKLKYFNVHHLNIFAIESRLEVWRIFVDEELSIRNVRCLITPVPPF